MKSDHVGSGVILFVFRLRKVRFNQDEEILRILLLRKDQDAVYESSFHGAVFKHKRRKFMRESVSIKKYPASRGLRIIPDRRLRSPFFVQRFQIKTVDHGECISDVFHISPPLPSASRFPVRFPITIESQHPICPEKHPRLHAAGVSSAVIRPASDRAARHTGGSIFPPEKLGAWKPYPACSPDSLPMAPS